MPEIDGVPFCDGCGAEIVVAPVVKGNMMHCCEDCAEGLPCECALILEDDRQSDQGEGPIF